MKFFEKIFSNKKGSKSLSKVDLLNESQFKVEISKDKDEPNIYSKKFKFNEREIRITDFNKNLNEKYKKSLFVEVESDFDEFWLLNNKSIDFNDAMRLISNYSKLLKKEKFTIEGIILFIDSKLSKFESFYKYENVLQRAKLYRAYSHKKALLLLNEENDKEEQKLTNPKLFIEYIYFQSQLLLKEKRFDDAFKNLSRTSIVLPKLEQFFYIQWSMKISYLFGDICYKEKNPKFDSYLFYNISGFLFDILGRIAAFGTNNYNFFQMKRDYKKTLWPYDENIDFDKALKELNIIKNKKELLDELFEFAYNQLPIIYGIPERYNTIEKIENITNDLYSNIEEFSNMCQIGEGLQSKFVGKEVFEIRKFIQNLIKEYYDENN